MEQYQYKAACNALAADINAYLAVNGKENQFRFIEYTQDILIELVDNIGIVHEFTNWKSAYQFLYAFDFGIRSCF